MEQYTDEEFRILWDTENDSEKRDALYKYLTDYHDPPLFPGSPIRSQRGGGDYSQLEGQEFSDALEKEFGFYPSIEDPHFHEKLFHKLEFAENKQLSVKELQLKGDALCNPSQEFELSPVQRFVSRFLSARSPYQSALLYHGVGVGKTCAGISIAESYLNVFPNKKVIIVAPPNIQPNFKRTIFDIDSVKMPEDENAPNTMTGCTGDFYLKLTGSEFEKEKSVIQSRVREAISARYEFMGYIQFHRYIETVKKRNPSNMDKELRLEFSGRLLIIDEAHNLRDVPGESADDNLDSAGGDEEVGDAAAGKRLTPSLTDLLRVVYGMKLVLLTATPMYNNYKEIIFILNLLLRNDKRLELKESDVFTPSGSFAPGGKEKLGRAAAAYVSFMRGENPLSFPIRLLPSAGIPKVEAWPDFAPNNAEIDTARTMTMMENLPLVPVQFEGESLESFINISTEAARRSGVAVSSIDTMVQSGNWLYPSDQEDQLRIRDIGFDSVFREAAQGGSVQYSSTRGPPTWLLAANLGAASPKAKFIIENIEGADGVIFVYSRFIKSGALPFALALEANGYTPYGRDLPFLRDGVQDPAGRQCALCSSREKGHKSSTHKFTPAKYILLTGKGALSPNNAAMVAASRQNGNIEGGLVKVIIGSQVASEGIDLKFVREIYVFDSWFHLNKMEQVLGRGVRTCSHALLDKEKRNTTIYLLVNTFPEDEQRETADLYMYRTAMSKAKQIGYVTRTLKEYALDCNLNIDAILIPEGELKDQVHIDAQGETRPPVPIYDRPFTAICDWIEGCDYTCANPVEIETESADTSTYDEFSAKQHEAALKRAIRKVFERADEPMFTLAQLEQEMKPSIPTSALTLLLSEIVGNSTFRIRRRAKEGYIINRNGYYLFQPETLVDDNIPLALRVQNFPVKQDIIEPVKQKVKREQEIVKDIWSAFVTWSSSIRDGSYVSTLPPTLPVFIQKALKERYRDQKEYVKEKEHVSGILWLYSFMKGNEQWRSKLADVLLHVVWDEMLRLSEQLELLKDPLVKEVAAEQIREKGERGVYRYVDAQSGALRYVCSPTGTARPEAERSALPSVAAVTPCEVSVTKLFETDPTDPLHTLQANLNTTGPTYGFLVPNLKTGFIIFKTTEDPAAPGKAPPKGGVCEIVTQISYHKTFLNSIGNYLEKAGLPRLGLSLPILYQAFWSSDEEEEQEGVKGSKIEFKFKLPEIHSEEVVRGEIVKVFQPFGKILTLQAKGVKKATVSTKWIIEYSTPEEARTAYDRLFVLPEIKNAFYACSLKNFVLRWMDLMGVGGRRWFFRPVAAYKSKHQVLADKPKKVRGKKTV